MNDRARNSGITLIELMVVIAILAIVGTIAVNSYRGYMLRSNRTEAKTALLRVQTAQEKFFLQNNRYADEDEIAVAPPNGLGIATTTPSGMYRISLSADSGATQYTAIATAQNGQLKDNPACQTLTIDHMGRRTPDEASGCWR
jgi:type IV pilus assembly protein PilE